jgi:hypothetical protein
MKYYTLKIKLCNDELLIHKNLSPEQVNKTQATIWLHGLRKKIDNTTTELLSPFTIREALIIEQENFESADK